MNLFDHLPDTTDPDSLYAAFEAWVTLLNEVRGQVLATVADPARRRELLDGFADWPWLDRIRAEGVELVRAAMLAAGIGPTTDL